MKKLEGGGLSASVHIRRTDYIKYQALIDPEYYMIAINKLQEMAYIEIFYIFTDDPEWAFQYFKKSQISVQFEIVSGNGLTDLEELMLMKECQHHIVANSSFSWWGGYLGGGGYEKKIVIAPKVNMWNENFYPKKWLLIDVDMKIENEKENRNENRIKCKDALIREIKEIGYL